jgi:hypothetical protein
MALPTRRMYLKHRAEPGTYAVEYDVDGMILNALDVTSEATKGGLCPHMLHTLPLAGRLDEVEYLNRMRSSDTFEEWLPDCGNVHHLLNDLVTLEQEHRRAIDGFAMADSIAKSKRKDMELTAAKVHELLARISDRKPLPLFEAIS